MDAGDRRVAPEVLAFLGKIETLPGLPAAVGETLRAIDSGAPLDAVADHVATDVGVAARILQIANSPLYRGGAPVEDLVEAVRRLGTGSVRELLLTISVVREFRDADGFDYEAFWQHSLTTAIAADRLLEAGRGRSCAGSPQLDRVFIAGLLHDIGVLVLVRQAGDRYRDVLEASEREGAPLYETERRHLGFSHGEVGEVVLRSWNLPDRVAQLARWHHHPRFAPPELREEAALIHLADWIAHRVDEGASCEGHLDRFDDAAWDLLSMQTEAIPEILATFEEAAKEGSLLFQEVAGGTA